MRALAAGSGRAVDGDETWVTLDDPRMPELSHGWKLHLSTRPHLLPDIVETVVPILLRHVCLAKFAASDAVLRDMNSGIRNPASVGKAITVYPHPSHLRPLAFELVEALRGTRGPSVPSDRPVDPEAPVYYRYGPFHAEAARGPIIGPNGERFAGLAGISYRQPSWVTSPFDAPARAPRPGGRGKLVAGRFELVAGVVRAPTGDVYRGVDTVTGERVVIKQARAFVGEDDDGVDARGRLRNERAMLDLLAGLEWTPRLIDYCRHGADEYLVTADCGRNTLRREVLTAGPFRAGGADRGWERLAEQLTAAVAAVHARGVVIGDLKPDNVVIDPATGRPMLIDFGVSARAGKPLGGATPGYSRPVFRAGEPARPQADHYALGATLGFALTGLDPVTVDPDEDVNRERTLACLAAAAPAAAADAPRSEIAQLMGWSGPHLPLPPVVTDDLLDEAVAGALDYCLKAAERMIDSRQTQHDVGLYDGTSGLGLELLNHVDDRADARDAVKELVRLTVSGVQRRDPGVSLFSGRAGVDWFLGNARALLRSSPVDDCAPDFRLPAGESADQITGAAGVGIAHLAAASRAANGRRSDEHLAVARRCAEGLVSGLYRLEQSTGPGRAAFADGFAHGRAGVGYFLSEHHRITGDEASGLAAHEIFASLLSGVEELVHTALRPESTRRYASWCRGLAGIAGAVAVCAPALRDLPQSPTQAAARLVRACGEIAPRLSLVSQCCGLSGVGEAYLDVALATGDDEFLLGARSIAGLILARSGGTPHKPLYPDNTLHTSGWTWGTGTAGVLAFLRRLRDRGGPRLGRIDERPMP